MMDEYFAVPISPTNKRARAQMDALLEREGIERDRNLTYSAAIYDDDGQMTPQARCLKTRCAVSPWTARTAAKG